MPCAIKICGVRSLEIALNAIQSGAHYIGLVFCQKSPRVIDLNTAQLIANTVTQSGGTAVGVFTHHDHNDIQAICSKTGITHVQLHGDTARNALFNLPESLHIIYAVSENTDPNPSHLDFLRSDYDFVLFDGAVPGSGQTIDWSLLKTPKTMRIFLAGGLRPDNVAHAIHAVRPYGVDVSSGVEHTPGVKSESLVQAFIQGAKHA